MIKIKTYLSYFCGDNICKTQQQFLAMWMDSFASSSVFFCHCIGAYQIAAFKPLCFSYFSQPRVSSVYQRYKYSIAEASHNIRTGQFDILLTLLLICVHVQATVTLSHCKNDYVSNPMCSCWWRWPTFQTFLQASPAPLETWQRWRGRSVATRYSACLLLPRMSPSSPPTKVGIMNPHIQ